MKSFSISDELLSAYLDGEVTVEERELVQRALVESPAVRRSLESLRGLQADVRCLPRFELGPEFCQKVLRQAERAMLLGQHPDNRQLDYQAAREADLAAPDMIRFPQSDAKTSPTRASATRAQRFGPRTWQRLAASIAVLAPALALMVLASRDPRLAARRDAHNGVAYETSQSEKAASQTSVSKASEGTAALRNELLPEETAATDGRRLGEGESLGAVDDRMAKDQADHDLAARSPGKGITKQPAGGFDGAPKTASPKTTPPQSFEHFYSEMSKGREGDREWRLGKGAGDKTKGADNAEESGRGGGAPAATGNNPVGPSPPSAAGIAGAAQDRFGPDTVGQNRADAVKRADTVKRLEDARTQEALLEQAAADGVVVVHLSVTPEAWESGAVTRWLAAYDANNRSGNNEGLGRGSPGAAGRDKRMGNAGDSLEKLADWPREDKPSAEGATSDRRKKSGLAATPADDPRSRPSEQKAGPQNLAKGQGPAPPSNVLAEELGMADHKTGQKYTADKSSPYQPGSVTQIEAGATELYSLLTSLHAQARAQDHVVSLAVVPPRQGGQYEEWKKLSYASGVWSYDRATSSFGYEASGAGGFADGEPSQPGFGGAGREMSLQRDTVKERSRSGGPSADADAPTAPQRAKRAAKEDRGEGDKSLKLRHEAKNSLGKTDETNKDPQKAAPKDTHKNAAPTKEAEDKEGVTLRGGGASESLKSRLKDGRPNAEPSAGGGGGGMKDDAAAKITTGRLRALNSQPAPVKGKAAPNPPGQLGDGSPAKEAVPAPPGGQAALPKAKSLERGQAEAAGGPAPQEHYRPAKSAGSKGASTPRFADPSANAAQKTTPADGMKAAEGAAPAPGTVDTLQLGSASGSAARGKAADGKAAEGRAADRRLKAIFIVQVAAPPPVTGAAPAKAAKPSDAPAGKN